MKLFLDTLREKKYFYPLGEVDVRVNVDEIFPPETQVFVLSPEVALAASTLVESKTFKPPVPSEFRMPYKYTAIEYPITEEIRRMRDARGMPPTWVDPDSKEKTLVPQINIQPISSILAFVIADNDNGFFHCTLYWKFASGVFAPPLNSFFWGVDIEQLPLPTIRAISPHNLESSIDFKTSFSMIFAKALLAFKQKYKQDLPMEKAAEIFRVSSVEAVQELPMMLFACNMLLNCKSGIGVTKVAKKDPPRGASELTRRKKRSSPYTLLYLNEAETVTSDGTINKRADLSAHYVRGHFKQRKSGIYWWNSFVRGSGNIRKRDAYIVKAA